MKRKISPFILSVLSIFTFAPNQLRADLCANAFDSECKTTKCYPIRPQGRYKMMTVAGTTRFTHQSEADEISFVVSSFTSYNRSNKGHKILQCLLGSDAQTTISGTDTSSCSRSITIQGSGIANRNSKAWLADYFYLPRDYEGTVCFDPRITTYIHNWDVYANLNYCIMGLYARASLPLVHTQWDLNMCEKISSTLTSGYPAGYFSYLDIAPDQLVQSFTQYMAGQTIQDPATLRVPPATGVNNLEISDPANKPSGGLANKEDGITYQPIKFARITPEVKRVTKLADIRAEIGWNMLQCSDYHFGINAQVALPTGNKKNPCFLFSPQVGTNNHWELGGGVTGHYVVYQNESETHSVAGYLDANITHLFKSRGMRTFDLHGKPNSAYMLASRFGPNKDSISGSALLHYVTDPTNISTFEADGDPAVPTEIVPKGIFDFQYSPVANLTTISVKTSVTVQADIVAMLSWHAPNFTWDVGYNLWARSREHIDYRDPASQSASGLSTLCGSQDRDSLWALKGDARMFGFVVDDDGANFLIGPPREVIPIPLSATESKATIHGGTNGSTSDTMASGHTNPNIDNPELAANAKSFVLEGVPGASGEAFPFLDGGATATRQINTSVSPIFLSGDDLDIVRIKQLSHTLFTNISFVCEKDGWEPFLSVGASIELGKNSNCDKVQNCVGPKTSHLDCALSQWSIWFKGGIAFGIS